MAFRPVANPTIRAVDVGRGIVIASAHPKISASREGLAGKNTFGLISRLTKDSCPILGVGAASEAI